MAKKRKKHSATNRARSQSKNAFPGLSAMRAAGVKAIDVSFLGCGDEGYFDFRVLGASTDVPVSDDAHEEMVRFMGEHFEYFGEGSGSVLLARFDLMKSVCFGCSGIGDPRSRLYELFVALKKHQVATLVGELKAGKFVKPKVTPASAMTRTKASECVNWFLERCRDCAAEYEELGEEYQGEEIRLCKAKQGTLRIDASERRVRLTSSSSSTLVDVIVDAMDIAQIPLELPPSV